MDCDLISYGTGTPVPKGFDQFEIIEIINRIIQSGKVEAVEFVEVNPLLDFKGNKMAETAFEVLEAVVKTIKKTVFGCGFSGAFGCVEHSWTMLSFKHSLLFLTNIMLATSSMSAPLTPQEMQKKMGFGINLGNRLDLYDSPIRNVSLAFFQQFVDKGFSNARVPVCWDLHVVRFFFYRLLRTLFFDVTYMLSCTYRAKLLHIKLILIFLTWLNKWWTGLYNADWSQC